MRKNPVRPLKPCTKCGITKPLEDYPLDKRANDGRASSCKQCNNKEHRKRYSSKEYKNSNHKYRMEKRYGLSPLDFDTLIGANNNCCHLCNKKFKDTRHKHIDHCHETGRVRGILCKDCNTALGKLGDNEEGLLKALRYLRSNPFNHLDAH